MIDFKKLKPGSLVRHKSGGKAYIVHSNYGDRVTAVRTADLTNPSEWDEVNEAGEVIDHVYVVKTGQLRPPILDDPMPRIITGGSLAMKPPGTYNIILVPNGDGSLVAELADPEGSATHSAQTRRETLP